MPTLKTQLSQRNNSSVKPCCKPQLTDLKASFAKDAAARHLAAKAFYEANHDLLTLICEMLMVELFCGGLCKATSMNSSRCACNMISTSL